MDSTVQQNRAEYDRSLLEARRQIDMQVQKERVELDSTMKRERAYMDRMIKEERTDLTASIKETREKLENKVQQHVEEIEKKLQFAFKEMQQILQKDRKVVDGFILKERVKMDADLMQARAVMDTGLLQERKDMDYRVMVEKINMEGKMMQDRLMLSQVQSHNNSPKQSAFSPPPANHHEMPQSPIPQHEEVSYKREIVMQFNVHKDVELSHVPSGYLSEKPGELTFIEPLKVEYSVLVENLCPFGYKREAELCYFLPQYGSKLPEGMTLISGPDDVGKMIDDLKGSKTCELYIVTNDYEDMDTEWASHVEDGQEMDCLVHEVGDINLDQGGLLPSPKQSALNNTKKPLDFGSGDELK